jgi:hypothetical protein
VARHSQPSTIQMIEPVRWPPGEVVLKGTSEAASTADEMAVPAGWWGPARGVESHTVNRNSAEKPRSRRCTGAMQHQIITCGRRKHFVSHGELKIQPIEDLLKIHPIDSINTGPLRRAHAHALPRVQSAERRDGRQRQRGDCACCVSNSGRP